VIGFTHTANQTCDLAYLLKETSSWILQPNLLLAKLYCVKMKKQLVKKVWLQLIWPLQNLKVILTTLLSRSCRQNKPRWRWESQSWWTTNPLPKKSKPTLVLTINTKIFIWFLKKIYRKLKLMTTSKYKNKTRLSQNIKNTHHAFHLNPALTAIKLSSLNCPW